MWLSQLADQTHNTMYWHPWKVTHCKVRNSLSHRLCCLDLSARSKIVEVKERLTDSWLKALQHKNVIMISNILQRIAFSSYLYTCQSFNCLGLIFTLEWQLFMCYCMFQRWQQRLLVKFWRQVEAVVLAGSGHQAVSILQWATFFSGVHIIFVVTLKKIR